MLVAGSDTVALLPGAVKDTYTATDIPGGSTGLIDPHGFDLLRSAPGMSQRITVLGHGRSAGALIPWQPACSYQEGNELLFPGEGMAVHYAHSAQGLRQNFMLYERPCGDGPLSILLSTQGSFRATLPDASTVRFVQDDGTQAFDYRDLRCWDAEKRPLDAHFELSGTSGHQFLRVVVDDAGAAYPITIDPVSTTAATLLVGTAAGGEFGISVYTAGDLNGDGRSDVAIGSWKASIGGFNASGVAYVHYGTNAGISTVPSVTLTVAQGGAEFGSAVGTAGDVNGDGYSDLMVGAHAWETDNATEQTEGGVFVYYGSAVGISTVANLILQPNHAGDNFGSNLACAGDINNDGFSDVIIGAYLSSYPTLNEGAVFIYLGSAVGLNPVPVHRLERNQGGAFFGRSVAAAGDINGDGFSDVIIGATKWIYTVGASDQGSAFVYYGSALGLGLGGVNPTFSLQLFGSGSNVAFYGWSVSSAGDLNGDGYSDVAVGAYQEESGGQTDEGLLYVYHGSASGLNPVAASILQSNQVNGWMGRAVTNAGDVNGDGYGDLLVGSPKYSNGQATEGIASIYFGSPTGISLVPSLTFELNNAGANFGEGIGPAGDVNGDGYSDFIVGARIYGLGGAAAVYLGGPYAMTLTPTATRFGGANGFLLGTSIANAGDVNGDGYADALVGAPGASNGQAGEGLAYMHYGSATGLSPAPSVTLEANVGGAVFGTSVASAGDVNGDGYADVVVGAPLNGAGAAYIFMGGPGGLTATPALTLTGGTLFGTSVATLGDVNHDGFSEVIVGSPGSGQAFVYRGSAAGLVSAPYTILSQPPLSGLFGCSVSTAGDVNGDGYSDAIVGASLASNGQSAEGLAYVYHGSSLGLLTPYARLLEVNQANANFGVSVSAAGDVNGDGYFDVVVGADLWESGQVDEGGAFVFHGGATGVAAAPSTTLQRNVTNWLFGHSVAEGGDVNGDGYADIVVGAPLADNPAATTDEGIAFVLRGSATGINGAALDQLEPNVAGYLHGTSVSGGGDVDGDGYSDVLVGAPGAGPAFPAEGGQYWYRGGLNRALNRITRQYDADLVTPMSTNSQDFANMLFFGIGHRARSPVQRCRARLRWEVVNEGQPYSGAPITNSVLQTAIGAAWTFLPLTGVEIKQIVPKAPPRMRYKWRVRVEYDLAKLIDGQRFSRWFYAFATGIGDIGVLPIELLRFEGRAAGTQNVLEWSTATENNSDRFEVLRSEDGDRFVAIGSVDAAGESTAQLEYAFVDAFPPRGTAYYQLRMIDQDGSEELSHVIAITRPNGAVSIFPNPAQDEVQVAVEQATPGSVIKVMNAEGRTLVSMPMGDALQRALEIRSLSAGTYMVVLSTGQGAVIGALPLIKQ